jgi:hypothetical protein
MDIAAVSRIICPFSHPVLKGNPMLAAHYHIG